jgi:Niemann-Pick C1 protein
MSCLAAFGGPIQPYVVLGDFNGTDNYMSARGLVITLLINNHNDTEKNKMAQTWETE